MDPAEQRAVEHTTDAGVGVVVPCFNEAHRLRGEALVGLAAAVSQLILVDDGSSDETLEVLREIAASSPNIDVLALASNVGKGEAVRAGLNTAIAAGHHHVGFLDADLATPTTEMIRLIEIALQQPNRSAVLGSRVALLGHRIERRAARHYLGRVYATAASWALGLPIYDTQCGAKVFRVGTPLTLALADPFANRWAFDVELLGRLLAHPDHEPEPVIEVPLREWHDVAGSQVGILAGVRATCSLVNVRREVRAHRARYGALSPDG